MNKLVLSISSVLALGAAASAHAQTGLITFNGEVTAVTCEVTFPGATGTPGNPTVTLPKVATTSLAEAGKTAGKTPITLQVGTTLKPCNVASVALELDNNRTAKVNAAGRLENTLTTGEAKNVSIGLRDANDKAIDLSTPWSSARFAPDSGIVTIPFAAEYTAEGIAEAGLVSSNVEYTVDYN